ncbi:hypothetical protein FIU95_14350 [Microbulbifer sp. THAF38]|nr:hypothetical protein FIU95_14350 [Microbulbifer sp. THAF38]
MTDWSTGVIQVASYIGVCGLPYRDAFQPVLSCQQLLHPLADCAQTTTLFSERSNCEVVSKLVSLFDQVILF